ncbi:SRPBCC family protein [Pseudonocardia sp. C8]|uniref:SRPBCC family protein n=1 Tax=Pseudonocardia sp. C8 TaxID=2762759 RepID=UPI0016434DD4|nr:SRPBCC family protein [Pseudonocardia sp. C8]MBC3190095.1 SRPBCC family protein [Pseudonocardia sp. C8]
MARAAGSSGAAVITLPADDQILITRDLCAPRRQVYRAWTTPELVERWWSGHRGTMTSVEIDLRVGGRWRYVMIVGDDHTGGREVAFHGEYREIVPNQRIVTTEVYEMPDAPDPGGDVPLNTVTFTDNGWHTILTLLTECPSNELRDAILESGMEVGVQEQMDLLEEVATLRQ